LPPTAVARAEAGLHVETQVDACVPLNRQKFEYLLNIELGTEPSGANSDHAVRVTLSCPGNLILITVEDAVTQKVVTRLVDLSAVDRSARARLMALTASELVLASWMEVRMEPKPVIPPAGPPPKAAVVARVTEVVEPQVKRVAPLRLGASANVSTFLSSVAPIFGLALHLTQPLSSSWAWNVSLQGGRGQLQGALGDGARTVSVTTTTAALAWSLRYTRRVGPVDLWAGVAGLFGLAYLTGSTPPSSTLVATPAYAPWAGPALQLAAAVPVSSQVRLLLQLDAGLLVLGVVARVRAATADDGPAVTEPVVTELRGGWLAANLGLDFAL
jgi:hypothetical protein